MVFFQVEHHFFALLPTNLGADYKIVQHIALEVLARVGQ
jgi:hypothetical protein